MSEVARVEESEIELLPPSRHRNNQAVAVLRENAEAMSIAHQYATAVCGTQVCPVRFRGKPDDGAAAILYGLEIGLSPSAALQKVVVIHGMPTLEARTMVALLLPRGYKIRVVEQSDASVTVEGEAPNGETATSTWTIERAIQAGYVPTIDERTGKPRKNANDKVIGNEKYLTDPQAMLKAKAQAEVCRDLAPDVLLGISYSTEELESERWDDRPAPQQLAPASEPVTVEEIMGDQPAPEPEAKPKRKPRKAKAEKAATESTPARAEAVDKAKEQLAADEKPEAEPDPPAQTEPTPDSDVQMATKEQLDRLAGLLSMAGFDGTDEGKEGRLDFCRQAVGRDIGSALELTSTEVDNLIELLDQAPKEAETDEGK